MSYKLTNCENCNHKVELTFDSNVCSYCGTAFNNYGEYLLPEEDWNREIDDTITDTLIPLDEWW